MAKKPSKSTKPQYRKTQRDKSHVKITGANLQPIVSRLDRHSLVSDIADLRDGKEGAADGLRMNPNRDQNFLADHPIKDSWLEDHPLISRIHSSPRQESIPNTSCYGPSHVLLETRHVLAVTNDFEARELPAQFMMNANGTHPSHRHQQPHPQSHSQLQREKRHHANEGTGVNTPNGPMPSHIQVAKPYIFHQAIEACLTDLGVLQAGEDRIRLAGVQWIDNVRKALKLYVPALLVLYMVPEIAGQVWRYLDTLTSGAYRPVRTFETAVVYYHKFRLSHADNEYSFVDAAAAALFAACKIEDTLKKSRDILCAAHNLKVSSRADHLSPDDPSFEAHSRAIIGLERLMLEASSFDFRNRHPQPLMVKIAKHYGLEKHSAVTKTAHLISLDLYRTFAPLKQNTATLAFACLELSVRLHGQEKDNGMVNICEGRDYKRWGIERDTVMETLLDVLELYTLHRPQTIVAPLFNQDIFLDIRIPLNEELSKKRMTRYTEFVDVARLQKTTPTGYAASTTNGVIPTPIGPANGRIKASPTSPATPSTPGIRQKAGERGKEGTIRFMLNPDREREEKEIVASYAPLMASIAARR